jgi:hypothetical protein
MYECNTKNKETAPGEHEYNNRQFGNAKPKRGRKKREKGENECSLSEKESKKGSAGAGMRVLASSRCQALINPEGA